MFYLINKIKIMTDWKMTAQESLTAKAMRAAKVERERLLAWDMHVAEMLFYDWKGKFKADYPHYALTETVNAASINMGLRLKYRNCDFSVMIYFVAQPFPRYYCGIAREFGQKDETVLAFAHKLLRRGTADVWWYAWEETNYKRAYSDFKELTAAVLEAIERSRHRSRPSRRRTPPPDGE
jgi:hypothetical protein